MAKSKKNSKKNTGTKSANLRYSKPQRNPSSAIGSKQIKGDVAQTCGITDPWCVHATGSKLPDSDSSKSVPVTLKFSYSCQTNAEGRMAKTVEPSLLANLGGSNIVTASEVSTWNADQSIPDYSAVAAQFHSYRIVSMGVRVYSTLAPTNQSGFFKLITTPSSPTAGAFVYTGGLHETISQYAVAGSDIHWIAKPIGVTYKEYVPIANRQSWDTLYIMGEGLPNSTASAVQIEVVMHLECQIKLGGISAALATKAADHKEHVLAASARAHSTRPSSYNGNTTSFSSMLGSFAKNALLDVATGALPYIGGSIRQMLSPQKRLRNIIEVD